MKVLDAANGKPVAILKNNRHIATLTPVTPSEAPAGFRYATQSEALSLLEARREKDAATLAYLRTR